ncbi:MAG: hypothetical protein M3Y91_02635 [Actinomycetota bacterium]|nr:hypothetical protein [Actinomycetota bacterium]
MTLIEETNIPQEGKLNLTGMILGVITTAVLVGALAVLHVHLRPRRPRRHLRPA